MSNFLSVFGVALFVLFFFGFCIFIHELGHFLAAKWRGLHIVAFSIGFKKIWGFEHGGIDYRIGCIPFGGYVDLPQIDASGDAKTPDGKPLPMAKPLDRIITAFAGPLFNLLFGFALATVIWVVGLPEDTPRMSEIAVAEVAEVSPEYEAGLRVGDVITKLNGSNFYGTWREFVTDIIFTVGDVRLGVRRGDENLDISYTPAVHPEVMRREEIPYPFFTPKLPVALYPKVGSAAAKAGIMPGDELVLVDGENVRNFRDFKLKVLRSEGKPMQLELLRGGEPYQVTVAPHPRDDSEATFQVGVAYTPEMPVTVESVLSGSPAAAAGLLVGDVILQINGEALNSPEHFPAMVQKYGEEDMVLSLERGGERVEKSLRATKLLYTIGVDFAFRNHPTPWRQFTGVVEMSYKSLRGIFSKESKIKTRHLSGPIGIVRVISINVYRGSIIQGLNIVTLITFSLGMLNLLPIPVLDGGHILLALIEMVFRRPLHKQAVQLASYAFVILLISFMLLVSYYDVVRTVGDFIPEKPPTPAVEDKLEASDEPKPLGDSLDKPFDVSDAVGELAEPAARE